MNKKKTSKQYQTIFLFILFLSNLFIINDSNNNTSALTYQDDLDISFKFNSSISLSLSSSDLIISDLAPGTYGDSNIITVTASTNNPTGYILSATAGDGSTYNDTKLVDTNNSNNNSSYFTSLATNSTIASMENANPNEWGYSYSTDSGTTWINPNGTGYSGLPYYGNTGATLLNTNTNGTSSLQFKIGARSDTTQIAGTYQNVVNFSVVSNAVPVSFAEAFASAGKSTYKGYYKMQDMSSSICEAVELRNDESHIQLIDTRDDELYWIGKLRDDRCWMLDNLRLGSNDYPIYLTPEDTNISKDWILSQGATDDSSSRTIAQINAAYKNDTNVTSYGIASGKMGVFYNYCAASAGTYCYGDISNTGNAEYDICPSNWRMPTYNYGAGGEYQELKNNYTSTASDTDSLQYSFSTPLAGYFRNSSLLNRNTTSSYWSSTYYSVGNMCALQTSKTEVKLVNGQRSDGNSIRCIANYN